MMGVREVICWECREKQSFFSLDTVSLLIRGARRGKPSLFLSLFVWFTENSERNHGGTKQRGSSNAGSATILRQTYELRRRNHRRIALHRRRLRRPQGQTRG